MAAMTRILLIGSGAREHVLAETFRRTDDATELFAVMAANNPGIRELCKTVQICPLNDFSAILAFAKKEKVDFAIIGPEAPLAAGIVDVLAEQGIPSVGPNKELAQLESSKGFARTLMERFGVPGLPRFMVLKNEEQLTMFVQELDEIVVKPDGLTGGKGVRVQGDHFQTKEEGLEYAKELLEKDGKVVIEERLIGEEFSLMSLTDGRTVVDCPAVQDHKRAFPDDKGPNTGGMGSYSDKDFSLPFLTKEDLTKAHRINEKMAEALYRECGSYFKGVLYGGFIVTKSGVKLIEYNVRFGDPEAMNVLPLLQTSLVDICKAIITGNLHEIKIVFDRKATVCKYLVPEGYPDDPVKGERIMVKDHPGLLYYASVDKRDDGLFLMGSRALAFVGIAETLAEAESIAQKSLGAVSGRVFSRPDIGTAELVQRRIDHMRQLRGE